MPVDSVLSQSTSPHAQVPAGLGADPSVMVHGACLLHLFQDCLHRIPVVSALLHSTFPHMQCSELGAVPSKTEQAGILLHLLSDARQCIPVVCFPVHIAFSPQTQGLPSFSVDPLVYGQKGAVMVHTQMWLVEHEVGEEAFVFRCRYWSFWTMHP